MEAARRAAAAAGRNLRGVLGPTRYVHGAKPPELPARRREGDPELTSLEDAPDGRAAWIRPPDAEPVVFYLRNGNVVPDRVDESVIDKLVELARSLGEGARVQGDDGEIYASSTEWAWAEEGGDGGGPSPTQRVLGGLREAILRTGDVVKGALAPKPFPVGSRVRDHLLGDGEVMGYEYGPLNNIVVKLDSGRTLRRAVLLDGEHTAGLELVDESSPPPDD